MASLSKKGQKGFTLVELMVAATISVIVVTMAVNIYLSVRRNFQDAKAKAVVDVKELTVKNTFYNAITNAGFSCKYGAKKQTYTNRTGENLPDLGFMYDSSPVRVGKISEIANFLEESLGRGTQGTMYQPNTDYIMIKNEDVFRNLISKPINLSLYLESVAQIGEGDYLALCNNDDVDIVRVTSVDDKKVDLGLAPSSEYHSGDYVGKYSIQVFYIAANPSQDDPKNVNYSLFMYLKDGSKVGVTYPIVDGVSDLELSYSILNRKHLSWQDISKETDLDDIKAKALKISFKIKDRQFEKIILL